MITLFSKDLPVEREAGIAGISERPTKKIYLSAHPSNRNVARGRRHGRWKLGRLTHESETLSLAIADRYFECERSL
jgi:hypothetical protein